MLLRARLDRIDRHVDGRIRILDYKTTDAGLSPRETHYQPRNKAWADLQLPLYRYALFAAPSPGEPVSVGYFNLPKAATDTRIEMFDLHPKDGDLYPSALAAARAVIAAIRAGQFWPPAQLRPDHDDFALLFAGGAGLIQEPPA
jgi:ATP-dependent helicase/nuclease subunit B